MKALADTLSMNEAAPIIDAQVHLWESNSPHRPWNARLAPRQSGGWEDPVTAEMAVDAMNSIGVDALIAVCPTLYADPSYAIEAARRFPGRIAVVPRIDLAAPSPELEVAEYAAHPEVVGIRVSMGLTGDGDFERYRQGVFDPLFAAARECGLPVLLWVSGHLPEAAAIARDHPDLQFVIDHLGLLQPPRVDPGAAPFAKLPELLTLADFPNVAVKVSGVPSLSVEPYPFAGLWPHLHKVIKSFGPGRLMWGSDFTQKRGLHSYAQALDYIRYTDQLSQNEKEMILGLTVRRVFRLSFGSRSFSAPVRNSRYSNPSTG